MFLRATLIGDRRAMLYCGEHGLELRTAQDENTNSLGGFLVPDELAESVIILREKYGLIAADAGLAPMGRDTLTIARRPMGSALTTYFANTNAAGTPTQLNLDAVQLVSKKLLALVVYPGELAEDAVIEMADLLADEMAQAMAKQEDTCGFIGDGTSTYAGMTGAAVKILNITGNVGVFQAPSGHTSFATLTASDFTSTKALLPARWRDRARWYMSGACYDGACVRLAEAAGSQTWMSVEGPALSYMSHKVRFAQVMPGSTSTNANLVVALFGDLSAAVTVGRRRDLTVKMSDQRYLELDQVAVLGSQRFDINCHGLGDAVNAGPIVALQCAAS
jgi:HK97 family phage major capsid protein